MSKRLYYDNTTSADDLIRDAREMAPHEGSLTIAELLEALADALEATRGLAAKVEALHQPFSSGDDCQECSGSHGADPTEWPCDTLLALKGDDDG